MATQCPQCGKNRLEYASACECGYSFSARVPEMLDPADPIYGEHPDILAATFAGWALITIGAGLAVYALFVFDPSVDGFISGDVESIGRRINNSGLMNQQLMLLITGGFLFVSGIIVKCACAIRTAIASMSQNAVTPS